LKLGAGLGLVSLVATLHACKSANCVHILSFVNENLIETINFLYCTYIYHMLFPNSSYTNLSQGL